MGLSFGFRLFLSFGVTLLAVGAFQYRIAASEIHARVVQDEIDRVRADAAYVRAAGHNDNIDGSLQAIEQALHIIAARPGMLDVRIVALDGTIVASDNRQDVGRRVTQRHLRGAVLEGKSYAGPDPENDDKGVVEYVVPVDLPSGSYALEVEQEQDVLKHAQTTQKIAMLWLLLLGVVLGFPVFYLLGARALNLRHKEAQEESTSDGLTGLGNHRAFQEELRRATASSDRHGIPVSLAILDVDEFKLVNDRGGHRQGDYVLNEVAAVLGGLRAEDRSFRIGGDEFSVILPHTAERDAQLLMDGLRLAVAARVQGVSISVGVASTSLDDGGDGLYERADAALYEAKRLGRNAVVRFSAIEELAPVHVPEKLRAVRRLLGEGILHAAFQPIWSLASDEVIGYEALARLGSSYAAGIDGTFEAFELAEAIGRTHQLDRLCRETILARVRDLPPDVLLFLNVSPQSLDHAGLQGDTLVHLVQRAGLTPERVVLEITERSNARQPVVVREAIRLRNLGFKLALDDVGAGNAGLEMLRRLPVDFVKVDREVVVGAANDASSRAVLDAIIAFAGRMGAFVIAEGVEDDATLEFVRTLGALRPGDGRPGIHGAQGYRLGRPSEELPWQRPIGNSVVRTS